MGVVLGLLSGFTYGAADFIGGLASRRSSTLSVVVISQLSGLLTLLALLPILPRATPARSDFLWGVGAGAAGAVGITLLYRGLAIGRMSVVSPITAVIAAVIPLGVGLGLHERPSPPALAGLIVALIAVVLVSTTTMPSSPASGAAPGPLGSNVAPGSLAPFQHWAMQPGLIEAILSGVGIGGFLVFLSRTHAQAGLWPLASSRLTSVCILAALAFVIKKSLAPQPTSLPMIVLAGVLDMLANAFYLLATRYGLLSIVAVLASLYPASTVLLARIVLHEKLSQLQRAGVAGALLAVALIAAGTRGAR